MNDFSNAIAVAWELVIGLDADLVEIVVLSLEISLSAVFIATLVALPLGATVAVFRFPGRGACIVLLNALMGLPPVAVGLLIYLLLSRDGPRDHRGNYIFVYGSRCAAAGGLAFAHRRPARQRGARANRRQVSMALKNLGGRSRHRDHS